MCLNPIPLTSSLLFDMSNTMSKFLVVVTIENKPYINDPEGETISRDLITKGGYSNIESVRTAKTLKVIVIEKSEKEAGTEKNGQEETSTEAGTSGSSKGSRRGSRSKSSGS